MKARTALLATLFAATIASTSALAQSHLRIGLAEDPDVFDPTVAGSYVGRIVLASLCDKLFDIDGNLNIVPQLALSHETSADGKTVTIKLRPGVKFHDGEPFDAEAAKFTLDRHMNDGDLQAQGGAVADRQGRGGRPADDPAPAQGPVLAADRAAHRPRRHDGQPEGRERGRRQVRQQADLRRAVQTTPSASCSSASCSTASRTTGTRTASTSTASPICRSRTAPCGLPICAPARST